MVPSTSGWPAWPIMTISRPCSRILATSTWTLVTSGHVASNTLRPRDSRLGAHRARHAMRAEHDRAAGRNVVELVDEHRALRAQVVDDEFVVDDFVANVDRRAELRQRLLDDRDGAVDAGAKAAGIGENDVHGQPFYRGRGAGLRRKLSMISNAAPTVIALSATLNAGNGSSHAATGDGRQEVVERKEIDDLAQGRTIPEVTERAAEDQAQGRAIEPVPAAAQQPDDEARRGDRDHAEQIPLPSAASPRKLNAAPALKASTRLKKSVIGRSSPGRSAPAPRLGDLIGDDDAAATG